MAICCLINIWIQIYYKSIKIMKNSFNDAKIIQQP